MKESIENNCRVCSIGLPLVTQGTANRKYCAGCANLVEQVRKKFNHRYAAWCKRGGVELDKNSFCYRSTRHFAVFDCHVEKLIKDKGWDDEDSQK